MFICSVMHGINYLHWISLLIQKLNFQHYCKKQIALGPGLLAPAGALAGILMCIASWNSGARLAIKGRCGPMLLAWILVLLSTQQRTVRQESGWHLRHAIEHTILYGALPLQIYRYQYRYNLKNILNFYYFWIYAVCIQCNSFRRVEWQKS